MFRIKREIINGIIAHAKRDYPLEACGYVAREGGVSIRHFEMTNVDQSEEHYCLDPQEQFSVLKKVRALGMDISAVYHSHPETPARPSIEDIRLAYDSSISYVIVSLLDDAETIKSFRIKNGEVNAEEIEIVD